MSEIPIPQFSKIDQKVYPALYLFPIFGGEIEIEGSAAPLHSFSASIAMV